MNYNSLFNIGFTDKIITIADIIPKVIYFIFAAISSGVDAMQSLVRKLAGLDVYYQSSTGEKIETTDPLTEFIYGILGYGENAKIYEALNTVFWSLAIFGVIILVITTIAAIIKSHYNEDTAGTSPWKYIYTAIKAVLTFAIIPFTVFIGLQVSNFVLKTLDQITSGARQESEVENLFGSDVAALFRSEKMVGSESYSYTYYDFFGSRSVSNTTTFSGMLFKASAYSCNRARTGSMSLGTFSNIKQGSVQIFGNSDVVGSLNSDGEKIEYVANQIDYAFANCLSFKNSLSYSELTNQVGDSVRVWSGTDIFKKSNVPAFSKWDVSTVWLFYNLWELNFIAAFGGSFSVFAIMISIIVGLMTRLIKGAALFIIYPSLLGLAPIDNFKAFKSWGQNFMQQLFMAFGSILGINLLLLLLPYVQSINFFQVDILNYMVNVVLLITGLIMAKDFITMVSGFVGGADANSVGSGMKGEVAGTIKKGAGMTAKVGLGTARVMGGAALLAGKTAYKVGKGGYKLGRNIARVATTGKAAAKANDIKKERELAGSKIDRYQTLQKSIQTRLNAKVNSFAESDIGAKRAGRDAYNLAKREGKTEEEAKKAQKKASRAYAEEILSSNDESYKKEKERLKKVENGLTKNTEKYKKAEAKEIELGKVYGLKKDTAGNYISGKNKKEVAKDIFVKNPIDKVKVGLKDAGAEVLGFGKKVLEGLDKAGSWKGFGKTIADTFTKTVNEASTSLGFDKAIAGMVDILRPSLTNKGGFMNPNPPTGDKLVKAQGDKREAEAKEQKKLLTDILTELKNNKNTGGGSSGGGGSGS